ncbi:hypothetical protein TNIN_248941 [Trichonephila inaurata madagascariensis]|uniref:Uncharacterized protein n=1 Tax=Trichonephila inaurata madagascariensis TaxID=2747483 RepID=A0A8X7BXH5_9ARAC|nr:hypothetical protein TNIN_248941 [Trichonephila inaurata madagascariensis]
MNELAALTCTPETHSERSIAAFLALCPKVTSETEEGSSIAPDLNPLRSVTPEELCPHSGGVVDTVIDSHHSHYPRCIPRLMQRHYRQVFVDSAARRLYT